MTAQTYLERPHSLSLREGWFAACDARDRTQPAVKTKTQLARMTAAQRTRYDDERAVWHANLPTIRTPQMKAVHDELEEILAVNRQDGDRVRTSAAIEAVPGVGKTTVAAAFGRQFHREQLKSYGPQTASGEQRVPVVHITLSAKTTTRIFSGMVCRFFAHPGANRSTGTQLMERAADCVLASETKLLIIDDVHFLNMNRRDGREVANHFKALVNTLPVTLLVVGVDLHDLLNEGLAPSSRAQAQIGRRLNAFKLSPFSLASETAEHDWRHVLLTMEQNLVLANKYPGMLADDLRTYLFARTSGHFASLTNLILRGCHRAIRTGAERLDETLLDGIKIDVAAERARRELTAAMSAGRLTSRSRKGVPTSRRQP
jgi:hypothetical protein